MPDTPSSPSRYIGLDIHKHYLVATGVDAGKNQIYGPVKVPNDQVRRWIVKDLEPGDAVVLEMTTNTWTMVDALEPYVHSVTVVHPPHVHLITRAQVMTDRKAALALAQLHAAGLLPPVWVPPKEVRDLRAIVAQRSNMVTLATQAKNRLQSLLHRHNITPPGDNGIYGTEWREWWQSLPLPVMESFRVQTDLETLDFANSQIALLEECLAEQAALDDRVPLLVQLPGIALNSAMCILAAIGDISRFESSQKLVGYAGLGARVHDSGQTRKTGRITKQGRKDLRHTMIQAAHIAKRKHPHWQAEHERLKSRIGEQKAKVAIARKLLVAIWYVLTNEEPDRYSTDTQIACAFFAHAYRIGVENLPDGLSAAEYTRQQLDRLGIGQELTEIPWGTKRPKLPPSGFVLVD